MDGELSTNLSNRRRGENSLSAESPITTLHSSLRRRTSLQFQMALENSAPNAIQVSPSSYRCSGGAEEEQSVPHSLACSSSSTATSAEKRETMLVTKVKSRLSNYGPCRQTTFKATTNESLAVEIGDCEVVFSIRHMGDPCSLYSDGEGETNDFILVLSMEVFQFPKDAGTDSSLNPDSETATSGKDSTGSKMRRRRSSKTMTRSGSYSRRTKLMKIKSKMTELSDGNSTVMRGDRIVLLQVSSVGLLNNQQRFDQSLDKFLLKAVQFNKELAACF